MSFIRSSSPEALLRVVTDDSTRSDIALCLIDAAGDIRGEFGACFSDAGHILHIGRDDTVKIDEELRGQRAFDLLLEEAARRALREDIRILTTGIVALTTAKALINRGAHLIEYPKLHPVLAKHLLQKKSFTLGGDDIVDGVRDPLVFDLEAYLARREGEI